MKKRHNLISCPDCEERGIKQNLAEITEEGIVIQRIRKHSNLKEYTIIGGSSLFIICGRCGNKVFIRINEVS